MIKFFHHFKTIVYSVRSTTIICRFPSLFIFHIRIYIVSNQKEEKKPIESVYHKLSKNFRLTEFDMKGMD